MIARSTQTRLSVEPVSKSRPDAITTTTIGDETLVGTINGGGCRLELTNANGNITIEKE